MTASIRSPIGLILVVAGIFASTTEAAGNLRHISRSLQTYTQTDGYQTKMLELVNEQRAANGLSSLCMNSKLAASALRHSKDMAAKDYMAHDGSDGSTMEERITEAGFIWTAVGENVAAGQDTVSDVMTAWMNSPEHKANILGDYKMFGTAYAYSAGTTYQHYWTQDFGTGDDESCESSSSGSNATSTTSSASTDQTQQQDATQKDNVAGEASTESTTTSPIIQETSTPATTAPASTTAAPIATTATPVATTATPVATTATPRSGCKARRV